MTDDLEFFQWGNSASPDEMSLSEIKGLFAAVNEYPFAKFIEFRKAEQKEAIVLELAVELPQSPPVSIHGIERVAVVFSNNPIVPPQFLALRKDFPETLHQNLIEKGNPKSLCLFEDAYYDVRSKLTSKMLLYRIGDWLARAAVGELHLSDQPIEPLLLTNSRIFFDRRLFDEDERLSKAFIIRRLSDKPLLLKAYEADKIPVVPNEKRFILFPVQLPPSHLRLIEYNPYNFEDLSTLLRNLKVNIQKLMQDFLIKLTSGPDKELYKYEVVILIHLPKMRRENGPIESHEYWAFLLADTIEGLAIKLGTHGKQEGQLGRLIEPFATSKLDEVLVMPLKPTYTLSRELAKVLSGLTLEDKQIVAIGAGALGSQAVLNLARQGFGFWHIVDHDYILPHNLSRHGLSFCYEGFNKAQALALEINGLLNDSSIARAYPLNILRIDGNEEELTELREIIVKSDLVIDLSTSRAVTKLLTSMGVKQQKLCSFITSSGKHLVALLQGTQEQIDLEDLTYQLSAAIIDKQELSEMYAAHTNVTYYSGSCRDASVQLPQDTIGLFASVISKFILANAVSVEAKIMVWSLDDRTLAITSCSLPVSNVQKYIVNGWTLRIPDNVIVEMQNYRQSHFPNETGGVLVGGIDISRSTIYVSKALSSPPDSIEWPNSYIRGVRGLKEEISIIHKMSGNELSYIGEWHSHPKGYRSSPSSADLAAHRILAEQMRVDGMPSLMLIVADDEHPYVLLNTID